MTADVIGQFAGRCVTPSAFLLHRLHHNPVQIATQQPAEAGRLGGELVYVHGAADAYVGAAATEEGSPDE